MRSTPIFVVVVAIASPFALPACGLSQSGDGPEATATDVPSGQPDTPRGVGGAVPSTPAAPGAPEASDAGPLPPEPPDAGPLAPDAAAVVDAAYLADTAPPKPPGKEGGGKRDD